DMAETLKIALALRRVHAPHHELLEHELRFLQNFGNHRVDHPTTGPVQTSDLGDCLTHVVHRLIGPHLQTHNRMSQLGLHAVDAPGLSGRPEGDPDINERFGEFSRALRRRRFSHAEQRRYYPEGTPKVYP